MLAVPVAQPLLPGGVGVPARARAAGLCGRVGVDECERLAALGRNAASAGASATRAPSVTADPPNSGQVAAHADVEVGRLEDRQGETDRVEGLADAEVDGGALDRAAERCLRILPPTRPRASRRRA
jgi:hypothetical protein